MGRFGGFGKAGVVFALPVVIGCDGDGSLRMLGAQGLGHAGQIGGAHGGHDITPGGLVNAGRRGPAFAHHDRRCRWRAYGAVAAFDAGIGRKCLLPLGIYGLQVAKRALRVINGYQQAACAFARAVRLYSLGFEVGVFGAGQWRAPPLLKGCLRRPALHQRLLALALLF